jgi:hypothetical protein
MFLADLGAEPDETIIVRANGRALLRGKLDDVLALAWRPQRLLNSRFRAAA